MSGDDEWTLGPDGLLERTAARIVMFDPSGRLFLLRGHDSEDPDHTWWFTPGGGLDVGEDPHVGAARELFEETGLVVDPGRLVGPVLERTAVFRFTYQNRRQFEEFFLLHVDEHEAHAVGSWNQDNLTELERDVLDEVAWWTVDEIERAQGNGTHIYPIAIARLARSWWGGWDGTLSRINEP
ncbi:NUDIX domain-containing protein [Flaviflexus salsibiostraticola]|uniref:NUDIX domain-containing protein n=1 Tax=Flaviflexus salsibiostraticola TaxID=1282737 RepID=A0A3Q8WSF4_9ACTO|nr:NUDIX domain-containing protein [Flaviflexus salsibiostraticola]AZN29193.1 NUDIX domain-containing protein [Flaviflexus salsibiostraticola]